MGIIWENSNIAIAILEKFIVWTYPISHFNQKPVVNAPAKKKADKSVVKDKSDDGSSDEDLIKFLRR